MWFGKLWLGSFHKDFDDKPSGYLMLLYRRYNLVNTLFAVVFVALYFILNQNGSTSEAPMSAFPFWVRLIYSLIIVALTLGWVFFFFTIHVSLALYVIINARIYALERERVILSELFKDVENVLEGSANGEDFKNKDGVLDSDNG